MCIRLFQKNTKCVSDYFNEDQAHAISSTLTGSPLVKFTLISAKNHQELRYNVFIQIYNYKYTLTGSLVKFTLISAKKSLPPSVEKPEIGNYRLVRDQLVGCNKLLPGFVVRCESRFDGLCHVRCFFINWIKTGSCEQVCNTWHTCQNRPTIDQAEY